MIYLLTDLRLIFYALKLVLQTIKLIKSNLRLKIVVSVKTLLRVLLISN